MPSYLPDLRRRAALAAAVLLFVFRIDNCVERAAGVVIVGGDGSGNTTQPEDDPGFANVGERGAASAIYLGNRWVMTAAHVGAGMVEFDGVAYEHEPDSFQRMVNPDGLSPTTDIILFRLQEAPPLPALYLGCETVSLGQDVVMIGRGRDRLPEPSFWNVTKVSGEDNDIWELLDPPPADPKDADEEGFLTNSAKTIRWGSNSVSLTDVEIDSGWGDVMSFQTSFDQAFQVEFEAQGVSGDSGGAVFGKHGSVWELVGMMHSVDLKENQPGGASTAIFGNETFIADLFQYADQLRELADFEPAAGDFDGDAAFTSHDIDLLLEDLRLDHGVCHFDLNADQVVSEADVDFWLSDIVGSLRGDADLDGEVMFADFLILADHFGGNGGWGEGDFTGDTLVEFDDFLLLSSNFGQRFEPDPVTAMTAAVPEPGGLQLLLIPLLLLPMFRFRARP